MTDIENREHGVNETSRIVHRQAIEAYAAGLCIIPPSEDGQKRPKPGLPQTRSGDPSPFLWDAFKTRLPTEEEKDRWYPGRSGLGLVAGAVSGNVEPWDFDDRATYEAFVTAARATGLGPVIDRIEAGYCDETAGNGVRWLARYEDGARNGFSKEREVLAKRLKAPDEFTQADKEAVARAALKGRKLNPVKILIEMTLFSILAPSNGAVHPSGRPYVRRCGSFATIASYTVEEREALLALARSFDEMPERSAESPPRVTGKPASGPRPGDDYSARTTWAEVLTPYGWESVYERGGEVYWRRPGKKDGISATTNYKGSDILKVFTTSTELDTEKTYSRFAFYTAMEHRGDFSAAAKALAKKGYGHDAVKAAAGRAERTSAGEKETTPRADIDPTIERVEYRDTGCRIEWLHRTKEKPDGDWVPLTNFSAKIIGDILLDDGIEQTRHIEIEARFGTRERRFKITSAQFATMNWPAEHLGAGAAVRPGQGAKDRARYAIQVLSGVLDEARVFTATGWTKIDDKWTFMHGGGALGPGGPVSGIDVDLPVELSRFEFPDGGGDLTKDVQASLAVRSVAPDRVTVPLLGAVARAPLGDPDFGVHISGPTGAHKSQLAALVQQHFGRLMNGSALPCNWSSTANSLAGC